MGSVRKHAQVTAQTRLLHAADGTALSVTDYLLPHADLRGSVVIMHGLGEHSGRYRHVAEFLNQCGLAVRCYDHRGHGKSGGARGDVIYGDPIIQDAQIVIEDFAAHFQDPPFLLGHSMGGLFAARLALAGVAELRGLILSSPALAIRLFPIERRMLALLHAVAPSFGVPNGLSPRFLSHDADVVRAYRRDPFVHSRISPRLLRSMLAAIEFCGAHAAELAVPTLMVVAGDDRLVDRAGSQRFFEAAPKGMVQLKVYEDLYHEVFNEPEAPTVFDDLRSWLEKQK